MKRRFVPVFGIDDDALHTTEPAPAESVENEVTTDSLTLCGGVNGEALQISSAVGSTEQDEPDDVAVDPSDAQTGGGRCPEGTCEFQGVHLVARPEGGEIRGQHGLFVAGAKRGELHHCGHGLRRCQRRGRAQIRHQEVETGTSLESSVGKGQAFVRGKGGGGDSDVATVELTGDAGCRRDEWPGQRMRSGLRHEHRPGLAVRVTRLNDDTFVVSSDDLAARDWQWRRKWFLASDRRQS